MVPVTAGLRVALLTNFVPPYRLPLLEAMRERVGALRVLISTPMERNRGWRPEWGDLDVVVQRGLSFTRQWRNGSFSEPLELHVPLDTIPRLRAFRPDVIVTGEMGARTTQAMLYGRATGTPVHIWATLTEHLELQRGAARQALRQWLLQRADGVIVNGASGASYIRRFAVPGERIAIVPQTTAIGRFLDVPLQRSDPDARRLLVVGRLTAGKGVERLLHALAAVGWACPQREIEMRVVGDGPERSSLQSVPLPANVHVGWTGHLEYDALPRCYARAGILAFPTLGDEWGMVVNEALAAGLPVLGSRYSQAVEELVRDGVNGWTFAADSHEELVGALERALATTPAQLAAMRAAARASIVQLTPDSIAERFIAAVGGGG